VKPGDTVLVYAAAGGVGSILAQWANHLGAKVIGCVGSREKAEVAITNGCMHTILYREENIAKRVKELTGGEGVAVVYDGVGKATFEASLDSLRPFGMMVSYGNSSGQIEPFSPKILAPKGSLYVTRPTLATHTATRKLLLEGAERLFDAVQRRIVTIQVNQRWPLSDAAAAQQAMESRQTTGSSVLTISGSGA
jgi:NADPH2:quinone reductase